MDRRGLGSAAHQRILIRARRYWGGRATGLPESQLGHPVRKEARNITSVLEQVPDDVDGIIIVDGNSTDVTLITAWASRPDVRIVPQHGTGTVSALYRPRPCTGITPRRYRRFRQNRLPPSTIYRRTGDSC